MDTSYDGGRAKQPWEIDHVEIRKRKESTHRKNRRKAKTKLKNMGDPDELILDQTQTTGHDIT